MDQLREFIGLVKRQHFWFLAPVAARHGPGRLVALLQETQLRSLTTTKARSELLLGHAAVSGEQRHPNQDFHDGMETLIAAASRERAIGLADEMGTPEAGTEVARVPAGGLPPSGGTDAAHRKGRSRKQPTATDPGFAAANLRWLHQERAAATGRQYRLALATRTGAAGGGLCQGFGPTSEQPGGGRAGRAGRIADRPLGSRQTRPCSIKRFDWGTRPPSTREVLYAQEDLWVLNTLIDIIRRTNRDALTRSQAAVKEIDFIQIAKDVEVPSFRVLRPAPLTSEEATDDDPSTAVSPRNRSRNPSRLDGVGRAGPTRRPGATCAEPLRQRKLRTHRRPGNVARVGYRGETNPRTGATGGR